MKPFMALAGLFHNVGLATGATYCRGSFSLPGVSHVFRDWKRGGHGRVDLKLAIMRSCDVYFYEMALALGIDEAIGGRVVDLDDRDLGLVVIAAGGGGRVEHEVVGVVGRALGGLPHPVAAP